MHKLTTYLFISTITTVLLTTLRTTPEEQGIISTEFTLITKHNYLLTPINIGTPSQEFSLIIDIGGERTWIHQDEFNSRLSTTYTSTAFTETKDEDTFTFSGVSSKETFTFPSTNTALTSFPFILVDNIEGNDIITGVLSLGREYDSKQYSIVYRLNNEATTHFNAFSLDFTSNENDSTKGMLHIGDVTSQLQNEPHLIDSCTVLNERNNFRIKWGCELTHMFVGEIGDNVHEVTSLKENVYDVKQELLELYTSAYFETVYNKILFPFYNGGDVEHPVFTFLDKKYFVNEQNEAICTKIKNEREIKYECKKDEVAQLKQVNFVFDAKVSLYLQTQDLFTCIADTCEFMIGSVKDIEHVVMGVSMLKKYHVVFDYNDYEIRFHSKTNKAKVYVGERKSNTMSAWKMFGYFVLTVVAIGLLALMCIYFSRRKNQTKKMIQQQIYETFNPTENKQ